MGRQGILDLLALATTLAFAVPIGLFGLQLLYEGRHLPGSIGVAVAVGLVGVEQYLWTPGDLPQNAIDWVLRRLLP